jgi:hypothetical protein
MSLDIGKAEIYGNNDGNFGGGAHVQTFEFHERVSIIEGGISGPSAGADIAFNGENIGAIVRKI